jgi:N-methylhydantoinase B
LQGLAGGRPGACNEFVIHRADGSTEALDMISAGATVRSGEWFELRMGSGGGYGDPLDRDPGEVGRDVAHARYDAVVARAAYGVVLGDTDATERLRLEMRRERLARAERAVKPLSRDQVAPQGDGEPLFPGIVQRGDIAVAEVSGAVLARAPDHWTDGCPVLIEMLYDDDRPGVISRSWLDPQTGSNLHVEAVLAEDPERFMVAPRRWVEARA